MEPAANTGGSAPTGIGPFGTAVDGLSQSRDALLSLFCRLGAVCTVQVFVASKRPVFPHLLHRSKDMVQGRGFYQAASSLHQSEYKPIKVPSSKPNEEFGDEETKTQGVKGYLPSPGRAASNFPQHPSPPSLRLFVLLLRFLLVVLGVVFALAGSQSQVSSQTTTNRRTTKRNDRERLSSSAEEV